MSTTARSLCIGCTAAFLSGGAVHAQEACTTYTVVAGDNLRFIARSAYGDADLFRVIYNANAQIIGQKADLIEIGARLAIPCDPNDPTVTALAPAADAPAPSSSTVEDPVVQTADVAPKEPVDTNAETIEVAAAANPVVPAAAAPAPVQVPIRMVTGNGYAPFADETLPGGGMFTQMVEMAIFRADPAITYNLTFISDWQAHIDALLPSQAYDLSFPWIKPDCSGTTMLSAGDQARCDDFVFSAPFYEIVDGFFAPAGSDLISATDFAAFQGKRICRPEGFTTGVLEAVGLGMSNIELVRPSDATDCFEALATGRVDLVSIDAEVGDSAISALGMTGQFVQNPHLMSLQSLHVIAHKSNPRAVEMVVQLDSGLVEMYESGEWYDIVSTALAQNPLLQQ